MKRQLYYILIIMLLAVVPVYGQGAGVGPAPGVQLQDEGTGQGRVQILNCVGTSIACTKSGVTGVVTVTGGITGTVTAGTSAVQNPFALSTTITQAHGLGVIPALIVVYIECLTAEQGYSIGDRVYFFSDTAAARGFLVSADAINTYIVTSALANSAILNRTTQAGVVITAANWKIVAVPYIIN